MATAVYFDWSGTRCKNAYILFFELFDIQWCWWSCQVIQLLGEKFIKM